MAQDVSTIPFENFFDSELESFIREILGDTEVAILLSSNYDKVHGFYATIKHDKLFDEQTLWYRGKLHQAPQIAQIMAKPDIILLQEFWPYNLYHSMKPTQSGDIFKLLVAVNLTPEQMYDTDFKVGHLREVIEQIWYNKNDYPLLLL